MKAIPRIQLYQWGLLFLVIGVVLWVFVTATQQGQSQEDIQAYPPPPTDILTPFPSDNTATPEYTGCCATVYPTQTPIVASQTVDLSPDLGEGDEYLIYVEKTLAKLSCI